MTNAEIETKVIETISSQLDIEKNFVLPDTHLQNDLSATSLDIVEIMMELERTFSIYISDEETSRLHTVHDFTLLVQHHLAENAPSSSPQGDKASAPQGEAKTDRGIAKD